MATYIDAFGEFGLTKKCAFTGQPFVELMQGCEEDSCYPRPYVIARLHGNGHKIEYAEAIQVINNLSNSVLSFYSQVDFVCIESNKYGFLNPALLESCKPEMVSPFTQTFVIASTFEKTEQVYQARRNIIDEYTRKGNQPKVREWLIYTTMDFPSKVSTLETLLSIVEKEKPRAFDSECLIKDLTGKLIACQGNSNSLETYEETKAAVSQPSKEEPRRGKPEKSILTEAGNQSVTLRRRRKVRELVMPSDSQTAEQAKLNTPLQPNLFSRVVTAVSSYLPSLSIMKEKAGRCKSKTNCCFPMTWIFSRAIACLSPAFSCKRNQKAKISTPRIPTSLTLKMSRSSQLVAKRRLSEKQIRKPQKQLEENEGHKLRRVAKASTSVLAQQGRELSSSEAPPLDSKQIMEVHRDEEKMSSSTSVKDKIHEISLHIISLGSGALFTFYVGEYGFIPLVVSIVGILAIVDKIKLPELYRAPMLRGMSIGTAAKLVI